MIIMNKEKIISKIKKEEQDIVVNSLKLAMTKREIVAELFQEIIRKDKENLSTKDRERIAKILLATVKQLGNKPFRRYIDLNKKEAEKERRKLKKKILNKITSNIKK